MTAAKPKPAEPYSGPVMTINFEAVQAGGRCGGEYLDKIGVEFPALSPEDWHVFLCKVIGGAFFGAAVRVDVFDGKPPF